MKDLSVIQKINFIATTVPSILFSGTEEIDDETFVNAITYLIQQGLIQV